MMKSIRTSFNLPEEVSDWYLSPGMVIQNGALITVPQEDGKIHNELAQYRQPVPGTRLFMQQVNANQIQVAGGFSIGFQYLGGLSNDMAWLDARIYVWNASQFQFALGKMVNQDPIQILTMSEVRDYPFENNLYIGTTLLIMPGSQELYADLYISIDPDSFMSATTRPVPVARLRLYNHPELWGFSSENYFRIRTHNYVNFLEWAGAAV